MANTVYYVIFFVNLFFEGNFSFWFYVNERKNRICRAIKIMSLNISRVFFCSQSNIVFIFWSRSRGVTFLLRSSITVPTQRFKKTVRIFSIQSLSNIIIVGFTSIIFVLNKLCVVKNRETGERPVRIENWLS